ncbi:MAG: LamG-like jellyroll fold domain-containing protein [Opitutales bacterium]|jgi:hypothetical protein
MKQHILTTIALTSLACSVSLAQTFDVRDFGATGDGNSDDTASIRVAIDAAGSYARENGSATVFFPAGTYKVIPTGTVTGELFRKENGTWVSMGAILEESTLAEWSFGSTNPASDNGSKYHLNLSDGDVSLQVAGEWIEESTDILDKSGNGWISGHTTPESAMGQDGDYYIHFAVSFDNTNSAAFELHNTHNNVVFLGEGAKASVLSFRAWGDTDPMAYEVDHETKTVLSSRLVFDGERYVRGSMFVLNMGRKIKGLDYEGIQWKHLGINGNTVSNGTHGWHSPYESLVQWDISHKGIVFTFGLVPLNNILVENCDLYGWRGEVLYKGGENIGYITIRNCNIYSSNGSAISISGNTLVDQCRLWDVYNGFENYCLPGQYTEVYNTEIVVNKTLPITGGDFGIVYLGTPESYLVVENCTISNADVGGVFLSEFASNVRINNNTFIDNKFQVYEIYLNQYRLPPRYENIRITNNTFHTESRTKGFGIRSFSPAFANDLEVTGNVFSTSADFQYPNLPAGTAIDFNTSVAPEHFVIENNVIGNYWLTSPRFPDKVSKNYRARWRNNLFRGYSHEGQSPLFDSSSSDPIIVYPETPRLTVAGIGTSRLTKRDKELVVADLDKLPVGFVLTITVGPDSDYGYGLELKPAEWNTLDRSYMVYFDNSIELVKNAEGKMDLASYTPRPGSGNTVVSGTLISVDGFDSVVLNPSEVTVYESFRGIPANFPVTVYFNENVRFANSANLITPNGGLFDPDEALPLVIIKDDFGVLYLQVGEPTSGTTEEEIILEPEHMWSFDFTENGMYPDYGLSPLPIESGQVVSTSGIGSTDTGIRFSGSHSGLRIPSTETINLGEQTTYTISVWIRPDKMANQNTSVIYEQGGYWRGLNLILDRGFLLASGWNRPTTESGWEGTTLKGGKLRRNEWNHVALVLDAGTEVTTDSFRLFLNGVLVDSGEGSQLWVQNDGNGIGQVQGSTVYLGRQVNSLHPLQAELDDLTIWKFALGAEEVEQIVINADND